MKQLLFFISIMIANQSCFAATSEERYKMYVDDRIARYAAYYNVSEDQARECLDKMFIICELQNMKNILGSSKPAGLADPFTTPEEAAQINKMSTQIEAMDKILKSLPAGSFLEEFESLFDLQTSAADQSRTT